MSLQLDIARARSPDQTLINFFLKYLSYQCVEQGMA